MRGLPSGSGAGVALCAAREAEGPKLRITVRTTARTVARTAAAMIVAGATVGLPVRAEPSQPWPTQVSATYALSFTGFGELGHFKFESVIQGNDYSATGTADVKVPVVYTWLGKLNGSGKLAGEDVHPSAYTFSSQGKAVIGATKHHSIRMSFKDNSVAQVNVIPPSSPGGAGYVPLRPENFKDAFDPLTAVMVMSRVKGTNPCARRIPIFDGKQRFDLLVSSSGQQKVSEARPSGQPSIGYLCKVRYIPIAGHKDNDDTRNMASNNGIEVALRPVPSAGLLVPYRITVPTKWGTASMVLQRMDIVTPGQKQIALVH
jgi:hypothetical protein